MRSTATWQRLPDITPNYRQLDRRNKMVPTSRTHEASVIVRDNVSTAHQLAIQLTSLSVERLRTIRMLNTNRQSFIIRQSVKQRYLERAGITDVTLLPPQLALLTSTSRVVERVPRMTATRRRVDVKGSPAITGNQFQTVDGNSQTAENKMADSDMKPTTAVHPEVDNNEQLVKPRDETHQPETLETNNNEVSVNTSSFMTHNFQRHVHSSKPEDSEDTLEPPDPDTHVNTDVDSNIAAADERNDSSPTVTCHRDRRFVSLMNSLSVRSPSGGDSYVQLSPSGSDVLERYSVPHCHLDRVRRVIEANRGTARLRYVRTLTMQVQDAAGGSAKCDNRSPRSKTCDPQFINGNSLIRSKTAS